MQPPLQQHLPPDAAALAEELRLGDRLAGRLRGQPLGHDKLRVQERPQHAAGDQDPRALQHRAPVGHRFPAGVQPPELGAELLAVGRLVREEELELQLVAQPHRLVPAVPGFAQQNELRYRAVHEVVDGAVAVERRDQVLAPFDGVDRLLPAGVDGDDVLLGQRVEHLAHAGLGPQHVARVRLPAFGQEHPQRLEYAAHLAQGQGAVTDAQQRQRDQGRRGHRGDAVDPDGHLEGHLLHREPPGVRFIALAAGPERVGHREGLGEADVYRADPGELPPGVGRQPAQPLRLLLRRPALLGRHRRYLAELVVGDRHRHQVGVVGPAARDRLGDVGQQAVARRAQLAGPRAAALHVPLEVEPLGQQVAEVLAQCQLVDLVVAGAAPDEDESGPPGQQADRPDAEVVAADYVVAGEIMLGEDVGEQQRVRVRAVAGQEHQRVAAVQLPQPAEPGGVGLDVPRVGVQRAQRAGEQVHRDRAHGRDQAVEVFPGPFRGLRFGQVQPGRELGDVGAVFRAVLDRLGDVLRHLVAVTERRPFGAIQREPGLPGHEMGERAAAAPALTQRRHRRGLGDHQPGAFGLAPHDVPLPQHRRPARVDLRQDVGPADPPFAAPLARQPRDAGGGDDRVRRRGGQRPGQPRAVQRQHRGRPHVRLLQPPPYQRAFHPAPRLGQQDQRSPAIGSADGSASRAVAGRGLRRPRSAHAWLLPSFTSWPIL